MPETMRTVHVPFRPKTIQYAILCRMPMRSSSSWRFSSTTAAGCWKAMRMISSSSIAGSSFVCWVTSSLPSSCQRRYSGDEKEPIPLIWPSHPEPCAVYSWNRVCGTHLIKEAKRYSFDLSRDWKGALQPTLQNRISMKWNFFLIAIL